MASPALQQFCKSYPILSSKKERDEWMNEWMTTATLANYKWWKVLRKYVYPGTLIILASISFSSLNSDFTSIRTDVQEIKMDIGGIKKDIRGIKMDVRDLKEGGRELRVDEW